MATKDAELLQLFGLNEEARSTVAPFEALATTGKPLGDLAFTIDGALAYRTIKGNNGNSKLTLYLQKVDIFTNLYPFTVLVMAYPSSIVIGPQLDTPTTIGTPQKSIVWATDTLAAPQLASQIGNLVKKVANQYDETVIFGSSPSLETGHFKNAATVMQGLVTLHGYWNPAQDKVLMHKIATGKKIWKRGGGDGAPPNEWGWAGGQVTLQPGLEGVLNFLEVLLPLVPLAIGGNRTVAAMATELYTTFEASVMTEDLSFDEAIDKKDIDELVTKFRELTAPLSVDRSDFTLNLTDALPPARTFLESFILSKVRKAELGMALVSLAKQRLSEGAEALCNVFELKFLTAELRKEIQLREEDRLASECSRIEEEFDQTQPMPVDYVDQTPPTSPVKKAKKGEDCNLSKTEKKK